MAYVSQGCLNHEGAALSFDFKVRLMMLDNRLATPGSPPQKLWREHEEALFRRGDRHWNPHGHALAAEVVARALIERGLVPQRSEDRTGSEQPHP